MSLIERLKRREVLVLDGATGTQLEARGAPKTSDASWADCSATNPEIVRAVHEDYIRAGADIITTNTYSTGPHVLRKLGRDDVIAPWNVASVALAREAVDRTAEGREVFVAGSASAYGNGAMRYPSMGGGIVWGEDDPQQLAANFREQIDILVNSGVDLIQLELLGATADDVEVAVTEALGFGIPVVACLSAAVNEDGEAMLTNVSPGGSDIGGTEPVGKAVRRIAGSEIAAINAMHSEIDDIDTILPAIRAEWGGPLGTYPNRTGFWDGLQWVFTEDVTPQAFAERAARWVGLGATIIGGCCGTTPDMISAVSEALKDQGRKASTIA